MVDDDSILNSTESIEDKNTSIPSVAMLNARIRTKSTNSLCGRCRTRSNSFFGSALRVHTESCALYDDSTQHFFSQPDDVPLLNVGIQIC